MHTTVFHFLQLYVAIMTLTEPFFFHTKYLGKLTPVLFPHTCFPIFNVLECFTLFSFVQFRVRCLRLLDSTAIINDSLSKIIASFCINLVNSLFYLSSDSYKNNTQCEAIQHCFVHSPVLQWNKVELNKSKECSLPNYDDYPYYWALREKLLM